MQAVTVTRTVHESYVVFAGAPPSFDRQCQL